MQILPSIPTWSAHPWTLIVSKYTSLPLLDQSLLSRQLQLPFQAELTTGHSDSQTSEAMFLLKGLCRHCFPYPECFVPRYLQGFLLHSDSLYLDRYVSSFFWQTYIRVPYALPIPLPALILLYFSVRHLWTPDIFLLTDWFFILSFLIKCKLHESRDFVLCIKLWVLTFTKWSFVYKVFNYMKYYNC